MCLSPGEGAVEKQLGLFQSEEAAASAYDTLAIELWGPSTPTNFHPQGVKSAREDAKADKDHGDGRERHGYDRERNLVFCTGHIATAHLPKVWCNARCDVRGLWGQTKTVNEEGTPELC